MRDEPNIPEWAINRLEAVLPVLCRYFPNDTLAIGGGTILQARWEHRISTDLDLFSPHKTFHDVVQSKASQMEPELCSIPGVDATKTWVEAGSICCLVKGVELTVLPAESLNNEDSGCVVPRTTLYTETTTTILYKKMLLRMLAGGAYEARDVFDLYTAMEKDPDALHRAITLIPQHSRNNIAVTLDFLPDSWYRDQTKPVIGATYTVPHSSMINALIRALSQQ